MAVYSLSIAVHNSHVNWYVFFVLRTLCLGFLHIEALTDAIYLFTPLGSASKMERLAIHEKWPLSNDNYVPGGAVTQSREAQVTNSITLFKHS